MSKPIGMRVHNPKARRSVDLGFDNLAHIPDDPGEAGDDGMSRRQSHLGPDDPFWVALKKERYALGLEKKDPDKDQPISFNKSAWKCIGITLMIAAIIAVVAYVIWNDRQLVARHQQEALLAAEHGHFTTTAGFNGSTPPPAADTVPYSTK